MNEFDGQNRRAPGVAAGPDHWAKHRWHRRRPSNRALVQHLQTMQAIN